MTCIICDRKPLIGERLPIGTAYNATGATLTLTGDVCGVCLAGEGWMSEDAYRRLCQD